MEHQHISGTYKHTDKNINYLLVCNRYVSLDKIANEYEVITLTLNKYKSIPGSSIDLVSAQWWATWSWWRYCPVAVITKRGSCTSLYITEYTGQNGLFIVSWCLNSYSNSGLRIALQTLASTKTCPAGQTSLSGCLWRMRLKYVYSLSVKLILLGLWQILIRSGPVLYNLPTKASSSENPKTSAWHPCIINILVHRQERPAILCMWWLVFACKL